MVKMKDDKLPKISETKKHEGYTKRGRPQLRWEECMEKDLRKAEEEDNWRDKANDVYQWKQITKVAEHWTDQYTSLTPTQGKPEEEPVPRMCYPCLYIYWLALPFSVLSLSYFLHLQLSWTIDIRNSSHFTCLHRVHLIRHNASQIQLIEGNIEVRRFRGRSRTTKLYSSISKRWHGLVVNLAQKTTRRLDNIL